MIIPPSQLWIVEFALSTKVGLLLVISFEPGLFSSVARGLSVIDEPELSTMFNLELPSPVKSPLLITIDLEQLSKLVPGLSVRVTIGLLLTVAPALLVILKSILLVPTKFGLSITTASSHVVRLAPGLPVTSIEWLPSICRSGLESILDFPNLLEKFNLLNF